MTSTGWVITIAYTVVALLGAAVLLLIFRSTRVGFKADPADHKVLETRETKWGVVVVAFLVLVLGLTIFEAPYAKDDTGQGPQTLRITGQQYAWTVNPPRVRANERTVILLRAKDVSHALGIYNPDNTMIKQANVLPGVTQRLVVTFDKPGKWTLSCLEFCGVNHHLMEAPLEVTR